MQFSRLYLIVLAAGPSTRFGDNKLLHPVLGQPMLGSIVEKLIRIKKKIGFTRIIVCINDEKVEDFLKQYEKDILVVHNPNTEDGQSGSIREGIKGILEYSGYTKENYEELIQDIETYNSRAFGFFVADQPYLTDEKIEELIVKYKESKEGICSMIENGVPRSPVIFSAKYIKQLMKISGDVGVKVVINANSEDAIYVKATSKELKDVDFRGDLH